MKRLGFTLIELLVAMTVLSIITGIVFGSFFAVTDSVELAREAANEVRFVQFLNQYFNTNLASAFYDLRAMNPNDQLQEEAYFLGEDDKGRLGAADAIEFFSTAPLLGGMGLPGDMKLVRIEVLKDDDREKAESDAADEEDKPYVMLQVTESSLAQGRASGVFGGSDDLFAKRSAGDASKELAADGDTPSSWGHEIQSFDVKYFDGKDWLDEWNWDEEFMMPWAVHIRINFWRPEAERDAEKAAGLDFDDDPDYELVVPIPSGMSTQILPEEFVQGGVRAPFPMAIPGATQDEQGRQVRQDDQQQQDRQESEGQGVQSTDADGVSGST